MKSGCSDPVWKNIPGPGLLRSTFHTNLPFERPAISGVVTTNGASAADVSICDNQLASRSGQLASTQLAVFRLVETARSPATSMAPRDIATQLVWIDLAALRNNDDRLDGGAAQRRAAQQRARQTSHVRYDNVALRDYSISGDSSVTAVYSSVDRYQLRGR